MHPFDLHVSFRNVAQVVERSLWEREVREFEPRHSDWVNRKKLVRGMGFLLHRSCCQHLWTHRGGRPNEYGEWL